MLKLIRQKPERNQPVWATVRGFNETHVLFDLTVGKEKPIRNMSRPIAGFMVDYGLV